MKGVTFSMVLSAKEKAAWEAESKRLGISLAAYIRSRVNATAVPILHNSSVDLMETLYNSSASIDPTDAEDQHNSSGTSTEDSEALALAPGSSSVSSPSSPPPVETAEEPSLPLTPSPPVRPKALKRAKTAEGEADFEAFYDAFPRHENKADAGKAWLDTQAARPPLEDLLAAVVAQVAAKGWDRDKQFCPLPASWLRAKRWRDEVAPNGNGGRLPYGGDPRRTAGGHPTPQPSQVKRFNPEDPDART